MLYILEVSQPCSYSLDELMYMDYLVLYSNHNETSLHPNYPFQVIELLSRREIIKNGLKLMTLKGLIDIELTELGIRYKSNYDTKWFLEGIQTDYSIKLLTSAKYVYEKYGNFSMSDLKKVAFESYFKYDESL